MVLIALPGTILGSLIGRRIYTVLDSASSKRRCSSCLMSGAVLLAGGLRGA